MVESLLDSSPSESGISDTGPTLIETDSKWSIRAGRGTVPHWDVSLGVTEGVASIGKDR